MSATIPSTPRADGFAMPGEFEPHAGTWLLWPERSDTWRDGAKPAQRAFARVAATIAECEPVTVGVSRGQFRHARNSLPDSVRLVELSADDAWMRDCGPTFVRDAQGRLRGVDWQFNAWGGLDCGAYFPWDRDEQVAQKVLEIERTPRYEAPLILEGGSIHSDGQGTLLTTESCLLHPSRNPNLSRAQIEIHLRDYTGAERILWLPLGSIRTRPRGMSITSPVSWRRAWSPWPGKRMNRTPITPSLVPRLKSSLENGTPAAGP